MGRIPNSGAKRHHVVPEFYMLRFSPDGRRVHVYDKQTSKFRFSGTRNVAVETEFNTVVKASGEKARFAEARLAELEGLVAKCFRKIDRDEALTREERWYVSFFAGFSYSRGTGYRAAIRAGMAEAGVSDSDRPTSGFVDDRFASAFSAASRVILDPRTIERLVLEDAADVRSGLYEIGGMVEMAFELARYFYWSTWVVAVTPSAAAFLTGDRPLAVVGTDGQLVSDPFDLAALRVLPISPSLALFSRASSRDHSVVRASVPASTVLAANVAIAQQSDRNVISSSGELLHSVIEAANARNSSTS